MTDLMTSAVLGTSRAAASARLLAGPSFRVTGGELCPQAVDQGWTGSPALAAALGDVRLQRGVLSVRPIRPTEYVLTSTTFDQHVPGSPVCRPPAQLP